MALVPFPGAASRRRDDDDRHIHLTDPDVIEDAGAKMSFLDHLDELRKRLIACVCGARRRLRDRVHLRPAHLRTSSGCRCYQMLHATGGRSCSRQGGSSRSC